MKKDGLAAITRALAEFKKWPILKCKFFECVRYKIDKLANLHDFLT